MATTEEHASTSPAAPPPTSRTSIARVVLIALGVLVVVVLVWLLSNGGGDDDAELSAPVDTPATTTTPTPTEEGQETGAGEDAVETFEVFAPRDPFEPLVSAQVAPGAGTTAGAVGATQITADGTTPTVTAPTQPSGDTGGSPSTDDGSAIGGHNVTLLDVFRQGGGTQAQVQVDGTVYTVAPGERFARSFELVSASGQCASMLFGDDQFTLCEGEEILK